MTFPNGLPEEGQVVLIKTIWDDDWKEVTFRGPVSSLYPEKGRYDWFGVYAAPSKRSGPIVTEWALNNEPPER